MCSATCVSARRATLIPTFIPGCLWTQQNTVWGFQWPHDGNATRSTLFSFHFFFLRMDLFQIERKHGLAQFRFQISQQGTETLVGLWTRESSMLKYPRQSILLPWHVGPCEDITHLQLAHNADRAGMSVYVRVCVCVCVRAPVFVCPCMCGCVYLCACWCVCMCVWACMCVRTFVCAFVRAR